MTERVRCPDSAAGCDEAEVPEHLLRFQTALLRWDLGMTIGLPKGLQFSWGLPLNLKGFTWRASGLDGAAYELPYTLRTPSDELLFAPGDLTVALRLFGEPFIPPLLFGVGIGASLPTGRTGANPFSQGLEAGEASFLTFGSGTVDPLIDVQVQLQSKPLGLLLRGFTRIPLMVSREGYKPPWTITGELGATLRPPSPAHVVTLRMSLFAIHSSPERWGGFLAPNSGLDQLATELGFDLSVDPKVVVFASLRAVFAERLIGSQISLPATASVGISGRLDLPKRRLRPQKKHAR